MSVVVEDAREQLSAALAELRQLAHGIHPAALTQGGLAPALEGLAARLDRVVLRMDPDLQNGRRLAGGVEVDRVLRGGRGHDERGQVRPGRGYRVEVRCDDGVSGDGR